MQLAALRHPSRLTIQARIALLVVACILPAWLLAALVTYLSYDQNAPTALSLHAAGAGLLLLLGLGLATAVGRSITRSTLGLVAPVQAIGKGEQVSIPALGLKEVDDVREALLQAQQQLRQREQERDLAEQAERQMLVAKLAAEKANEAKAVFLSSISHELRTPLNAILGFCRLMRNARDVTAGQTRNLDIINNSGEHLLRLINNVLDLTKIESGHMALEESAFDLHQLLHEIGSLMQVPAAQKGLGFHLALSPELPRHVIADARKLRQVLINLLGNAIKFTAAGEVWLRAGTTPPASAQSARVRFEVEDSGPGIDEKDRRRIFAPFEQLIATSSTEIGTGLGLHISKQFVELMGGAIDFSTVPGKGSVFHLELALRTTGAAAGVVAKPDRGRVTGLAPGQGRHRLLVAEDQLENRLLLHALLEPLGFELRDAVNGREAVALAEQWHPHLIWMDMRMPELDGLQATRQIKASAAGAQVKVIAITAHVLESEVSEFLAAGCEAFIRKPYYNWEIFEALEVHLGVRFLYAEERLPAAVEAAGLSIGRLLQLPAALLDELRQAALLLDGPRCLELAGTIGAIDGDSGARLRRMIANLQYRELLEVLEQSIRRRSA